MGDFKQTIEALDRIKQRIAQVMPAHMRTAGAEDRIIQSALGAIRANNSLGDCDLGSLQEAVLKAAQLGLSLDPALGHCYLVPKKNRAEFQMGYRGYIELAGRSGNITSVTSEVVYVADRFSIKLGAHRDLIHEPYMDGERGERRGAYAVVEYKDGKTDFEYMSKTQILDVKKSSKAGNSGPWQTHEDEMWRKCPIRRLAKRLPLKPEDQVLLRVAVEEEYAEAGFDLSGRKNSDTSDLRARIAAARGGSSGVPEPVAAVPGAHGDVVPGDSDGAKTAPVVEEFI